MFGQSFRVGVRGQQRFDFRARFRVLRAGSIEKRIPLGGIAFQRRPDDLLNLRPLLRRFHAFLFSSLSTNAFATFQSRLTVEEEMPSTSAISSIASPPEKVQLDNAALLF